MSETWYVVPAEFGLGRSDRREDEDEDELLMLLLPASRPVPTVQPRSLPRRIRGRVQR